MNARNQVRLVVLLLGAALFAGSARLLRAQTGPRVAAITALATSNAPPGKIECVTLLGDGEELEFTQDSTALHVKLPTAKPCDTAHALKITGLKLE